MINRIFLIAIIFFSLISFNGVNSQTNKDIIIDGNENIDDEVIFSIIGNDLNDLEENDINIIIKKLFDTGNFKNVEVINEADKVIIKITENPIVNEINFIGNKRFKKEIIFEQFNKSDYFQNYNINKIYSFIDDLKKLYNSFGYNLIEITFEIAQNQSENNFIDLNFYIDEGSISKIDNIYFINSDNFNKRELLSVIKSKPKNFFRFFNNVNFKKYQIQNDLIRIKNHYNNNGFRNVSVDYKTEFIPKKNRFNIYFYLNEGIKYNFNQLSSDTSRMNLSQIQNEKVDLIINNFYSKKIKKNNHYNKSYLEEIKELITDYLYSEGQIFFDIDSLEKITENEIDILFRIQSSEPKYVNQINIYGNTRTNDKVIRREIVVAEGDAVNDNLISRSKRNINSLGIFKKATIKEKVIQDDKINLEVQLEEKSTGQFQIGVGFGTLEGATFTSGLSEKNFGGEGRQVDLTINTADKNTKYNFGIVEPYILNKKLNFIYGISYEDKDLSKSSSYDFSKFNTNTGFKYELIDDLNHTTTLEYSLKDYTITDSNTVADSIAKQSGNNADILFKNRFIYNKLNSFIRPTKGTYVSYVNGFSPVTNSDNGYLKNIITYKKYYNYDKNILSIQTKLGNIISLQNDEILTDDKFSLGGRWLRGFDSYGAGPRNSRTSYIGGNNIIVTKVDLQRPLLRNSDNPIDLNLFLDAGTVFDNKTKPTNSNESIRSSYGFGIKFYSPIGPVGFSWAFPIESESYDIERMFLFTIGNLN